MAVIAVADMFGISGRRDELLALLVQAEREATARPGCVRYTFATAIADADHFVLLSEWDNQEALDEHYRSPEFASFQSGLNGVLARPSQMTIYSAAGAARPVETRPMDPRDAD
jgi:quinol monooxygenase YgiN